MLAMSMGLHRPPAAFNPNFNIAFGTGLPMASLITTQPMHLGGFPGASPGFHAPLGGHANLFGYGPSFAMAHHPTMTANPAAAAAAGGGGNDDTTPGPRRHSSGSNNNEERHDGGHNDGNRRHSSMSGMTPMVFGGGVPTNNPMVAAPAPLAHPAVMQVVSSDSAIDHKPLTDIAGRPVHRPMPSVAMSMVPVSNVVGLQKPKKWIRWSEQEDALLRRAVMQWGEGAFREISEQIFRGSRTENQCKNRWKKVSCNLPVLCIFFGIGKLTSHLSGSPTWTRKGPMDEGGGQHHRRGGQQRYEVVRNRPAPSWPYR